jgi:cytochrome c oxidase assembly factor 7
MDNGTACFYLSGMHVSGVLKKDKSANTSTTTTTPVNTTDFIVQKGMKKAFDYASKACDLNNMYACANLSQMYMREDGTEKNEKKAEQFKTKALAMQEELKNQQAELKF